MQIPYILPGESVKLQSFKDVDMFDNPKVKREATQIKNGLNDWIGNKLYELTQEIVKRTNDAANALDKLSSITEDVNESFKKGQKVMTPDGPGSIESINGDSILVIVGTRGNTYDKSELSTDTNSKKHIKDKLSKAKDKLKLYSSKKSSAPHPFRRGKKMSDYVTELKNTINRLEKQL